MAQSSWPFHDGSDGTPVLEDEWSIMARQWAPSGVVDGFSDELEVYGNSSGMEVHVKAGRACVRGHWYESTAVETLAIAANSSGNSRTDRVVLKLDPSEDSIVLAIKQGTPATIPEKPTLTTTDVGVYEMTIGYVNVASGASTITAGNVGTERTFIGTPVTTTGATMSGAIAMGAQKITGLAAGSAAGDAVRYEQMQDAASRFTAGSINTAAAIHGAVITPPAGKVLSRVVVSVSGTSIFFLAANGYQQVVVGAEIQTPATGAVNILRQGVGSGASTTALTIYVDYVAYFV